VMALREIAAGLVSYGILNEVEIRKSSDDELSELVQADALRKARQDLSISEAMDADLIEEDDEAGAEKGKSDDDDGEEVAQPDDEGEAAEEE
jgi:hypothetical protein